MEFHKRWTVFHCMLYEKYGLELIRHFCSLEGVVPPLQSPLQPFLSSQLPDTVSIQDASLEVLCLLRVLHALNRYWGTLYPGVEYVPILSQQVCIVDSRVFCELVYLTF